MDNVLIVFLLYLYSSHGFTPNIPQFYALHRTGDGAAGYKITEHPVNGSEDLQSKRIGYTLGEDKM